MKRIFGLGAWIALILLFSGFSVVQAAPAAPVEHTLTQPDGASFLARQWGDEFQNGFETLEGYTILQTQDGWWVYAELAEDGSLAPALREGQLLIVGRDAPDGLAFHLRPAPLESAYRAELGETGGPLAQNIGTQPVLVLLAKFDDRANTYSAPSFATLVFGDTNSVKDYYADASFDNLILAPAAETYGAHNDGVVGWLSAGAEHPDPGTAINVENEQIARNVLLAADPYVNFAPYDTNADGFISNNELHIIVIVAGYERGYDTQSPSVWGHRGWFAGLTPPVLDGKTIGKFSKGGGYAEFGEIHGDHQATIGIMAHEMGHDLSWPDLYDLDGSSSGVGVWSLMGSGSWNGGPGGGESPALPDAWLKWYQGWITPTAVNGAMLGASIARAETNPVAYLLRPNPSAVNWDFMLHSGTGEFFLVENRQKTGYDSALPGCGLLIWHVDESVTSTNDANKNEDHPLVKLIQADGLTNLEDKENYGDGGDPYPGTSNKLTFNNTSTPNSRLYDGSNSLVSVTNISASCAPLMKADLKYNEAGFTFKVFIPMVAAWIANPIRNGTFEAGPDGSWTEYSLKGWDLILAAGNDPIAHSGAWHAWLGGDDSETARLTQTGISMLGQRYLHFWYLMYSTDSCGHDYARIKVNGSVVKTYNLCSGNNTAGWVKQTVDLNAYAGAAITLQFEVTTNSTKYSSFYLDDVSISPSSSVAAESGEILVEMELAPR